VKAKNCNGNHDRQTKDIKTAPFDQRLTKSRQRKHHKADDMKHDVMVEILYQTEEVNNITDPKPLDLYGHSTGVEMSPLIGMRAFLYYRIIAYDRSLQEDNKNKAEEDEKKSLFRGKGQITSFIIELEDK
jgi:hypothetical protein